MEETVIVIMLKEKETGFLEKELSCYHLGEQQNIILNIYAEETEQNIIVFMKLTCERDVEDWEYNAILDYYDTETVKPFVNTIEEVEGEYNPVWLVTFPFLENQQEMEQKLCLILQAHQKELYSVYEAIADKKDDYIE